jgi:hypothetical protein
VPGSVKAEIVRSAATIVGFWARDRLRSAHPTKPGATPPSVRHLSNEWLTSTLCSRCRGATVVDFQVGSGSDGTSARRPLKVSYNEVGVEAGLPTALYTKSTPSLVTRLMYGLNGLAQQEGSFYTRIAPELQIETPKVYGAVFDPRSAASMLILDDLLATRGAVFGDMLTGHFTREQAEGMVTLMAKYHGAFWASPRLEREFTWLNNELEWQRRFTEGLAYRRMFRNGWRRANEVLPRSIAGDEARLWDGVVSSVELCAAEPPTLLHRDTHSRNWYITNSGQMGLYDWQVTGKGSWALDVSYALGVGLRTDDRRAWEHDLLDLYLDQLRAAGGQPPSAEQARRSYRQQIMHGLAYWLATIGVMKFQPQTQPRDVCRVAIGRLAQAVEDLESLSAVSSR